MHRNIKPENILIKDNKYKLADFALAKWVLNFNSLRLSSKVGCFFYMSP